MNEPWIKLYRKFTEWEWYSDINCKVVFLHLLLTANWQPKRWQGRVIDVGEVITGRENLAEAVGIGVQQVRTALKKLVDSDVIEVDTTNRFTVIKIKNYEKYQEKQKNQPTNNHLETLVGEAIEGSDDSKVNQQITNNQPTTNQQLTTPKELKKDRIIELYNTDGGEDIYNINNIYSDAAPSAAEKELSEVPSSDTATGVPSPEEIGKVFKVYEQNIGVLSPMIVDVLKERITAQGAALVSLAVAEAVKNNAKSIRYVEKVLGAWERDGIKTIDAAKLRIAQRWQKSNECVTSSVQKSNFRNYPKSYGVSDAEKMMIDRMMKKG